MKTSIGGPEMGLSQNLTHIGDCTQCFRSRGGEICYPVAEIIARTVGLEIGLSDANLQQVTPPYLLIPAVGDVAALACAENRIEK